MAHAHIAPTGAASRPLRAFNISLCSAGQRLAYTALARSSGEALCNALPQLAPPIAASVKPAGSSADALRVYRRKLALADLVE